MIIADRSSNFRAIVSLRPVLCLWTDCEWLLLCFALLFFFGYGGFRGLNQLTFIL